MKKVFSKEKFIEDMGHEEYQKTIFPYGSYVDECDGLTEEEMEELGYLTDEDWMIETEYGVSEKDFIEIL